MKVDLLVFPLVTAAAVMVSTTVWVTTVTFGRLLRIVVPLPGTGGWITMFQMCPGSEPVCQSALVFVA